MKLIITNTINMFSRFNNNNINMVVRHISRIKRNNPIKEQCENKFKRDKFGCNKEECELKNAQTNVIGFIFVAGSIVELYTFKHTGNFSSSTGLGWSLLAIMFIV